MLRDRGLMKYRPVAFMPEQIASIKQMYKEQDDVKMPELDEQHLEKLDQTICNCMEFNLEATVTFYKKARYEITKGTIHYMNEYSKYIRVVDSFDQWTQIELKNIIDIRIN
ncbi:YolD-like family protein [Robertmurraya sp. FSL R5-0851]|uniref:YolD-like family protein n=1 Tax=Robertmurraya sp. FSL R5-0851 TaxID=2921584 RepID=UPI0030FC56BD